MSDVLDQAADDHVPIGREFYGRARDLRRCVAAEDEAYLRTVHAIMSPVTERLRRHPERSLRPAMLADVVQRWMNTEHRLYRLDLGAKLERVRATLTERRLCAGKSQRIDDPLWVGSEDDLGVNEVQLVADKANVRIRTRCLCTFGLHAIARYWQRTGLTDEMQLMRDIDLVAAADRDRLVVGAGFMVPTHEDGGGWRGRAIMQDGLPVLAVRTWLPSI